MSLPDTLPMQTGTAPFDWKRAIRSDFPASIIVFLVALPLCIGIASASGAPAATGLVTGIIGGLVVGALSGSPLQVSGPAAGLFVLVAQVIDELGLVALGPVVLGAGALQMAAAKLRLGNYFRAVSPAVIQGMLSGIGVLIVASEFHAMVDDHDAAQPWLEQGFAKGIANLLSMPQSLWLGIVPLDGSPHHLSAALGVGTIALLTLWKFVPWPALKAVPGAVVAVVLAAAVTRAMGWEDVITHVTVPTNLLEDLAFPAAWPWGELDWRGVLFAAAEIAVVASAETMLCCAAVDQMQSFARTKYDRELFAQGAGNALCGLVGALPMTGVIVRSSANVQAGGRTRLSAWLHGLWLLVFVAALPWLLNYIPRASLAAVLVFTGWKLVNLRAIRGLWRVSRPEGVIAVLTMLLVVGVDLLTGVLVGVACTAAWLLYTFARLDVELEHTPGAPRTDLHLRGAATFLGVPQLVEALDRVEPSTELHVALDRVHYVDHSCLELLVNWEKQHSAAGGKLVMDWDGLATTFRRAGGAKPGANGKPAARPIDWLRKRLGNETDPNPLGGLFENNRAWAEGVRASDPAFFEELAQQQKPAYLWIGCADSRVPANQIVGLPPGSVFVHRNIANVVVHTDVNCLSVLEYAVQVLGVRHVIVCGHYGCGGVAAALGDRQVGLIDNWLRHIRDTRQKHIEELVALPTKEARLNRLCELNVIEQVKNVCHTSIVQQAWSEGRPLSVHGVIYGLSDGLLRDLGVSVSGAAEVAEAYRLNGEPVA